MATETCWRCGATMEWRHGTWQCPLCRLKLGCCEGEPQSTCTPARDDAETAAPFTAASPSGQRRSGAG